MRVLIYPKGSSEPRTYELDLKEFQRLSRDYECYLRGGAPTLVSYTYYTDLERKITDTLWLDFSTISLIG